MKFPGGMYAAPTAKRKQNATDEHRAPRRRPERASDARGGRCAAEPGALTTKSHGVDPTLEGACNAPPQLQFGHISAAVGDVGAEVVGEGLRAK